jgi:hypothetical protein
VPVIVSLTTRGENERKALLTKDHFMKKSIALGLLALVISLPAAASWKKETRKILKDNKYACKSTEVVVDSIIKDDKITGHIKGLPQNSYSDFKVVFYVQTNRWYVHPFEGSQEGLSYANLTDNGNFAIRTVRREIPSKQLVAVLVPKTYKIKSQRFLLKPFLGLFGGILKYECAHTIVKGNGDFFTL